MEIQGCDDCKEQGVLLAHASKSSKSRIGEVLQTSSVAT
jgi:hypothetical protein